MTKEAGWPFGKRINGGSPAEDREPVYT